MVYAIVAVVVAKKAVIRIGLSEEWFSRRRRTMLTAWGLALLGIVMFVGSLVLGTSLEPEMNGVFPIVMVGGLLVGFGGTLYGALACRMVTPARITDTHVWLKGVHPRYLDALPEWTGM